MVVEHAGIMHVIDYLLVITSDLDGKEKGEKHDKKKTGLAKHSSLFVV